MLLCALVVAEAVVGEPQGLGEQPALAVVLGEEGFDALLAVAVAGADLVFEIVEGEEGEYGVAEFGVFRDIAASPKWESPKIHN